MESISFNLVDILLVEMLVWYFSFLLVYRVVIYIICLIILVGRVFWNIRGKQGELAAMRRIRRLVYQVWIDRKKESREFSRHCCF